jgi:hypothetical protein
MQKKAVKLKLKNQLCSSRKIQKGEKNNDEREAGTHPDDGNEYAV